MNAKPGSPFEFHDASQLSPRDIYNWMAQLIVPRPIAWVTSLGPSGVVNLAPFSFFNGVCSQPPTLMLSITHARGGLKKDTLRNIEISREFVVNLSPWRIRERINQTSAPYPPEVSEAEEIGAKLLPSVHVRPPRLAETPAQFECRLDRIIEIGEGRPGGASLVLGQILGVHVDPGLLREGRVDPRLLDPASRLGGSQWAALGEIESLERAD